MYLQKKLALQHKPKPCDYKSVRIPVLFKFPFQNLNSGLTNREGILPVNMRLKFTMKFLNFMSKFTKQNTFFFRRMKQTPSRYHTDKNLNLNLYDFQKFSFFPNS